MHPLNSTICTAFDENQCIASGELLMVAEQVKKHLEKNPNARVLIFDDATSQQVEIDFRGSVPDVLQRLTKPEALTAIEKESRGPGRPKLGVISREVTLLPRHWDWLNSQSGGASVALRKLVEKAKHENAQADVIRLAQESSYRFMSAIAGDQPGYEEAIRALFAGNQSRFHELIEPWPKDIRNHTIKISHAAFGTRTKPQEKKHDENNRH